MISHRVNDSFIALNRLLGAKKRLLASSPMTANGRLIRPGALHPAKGVDLPMLQKSRRTSA